MKFRMKSISFLYPILSSSSFNNYDNVMIELKNKVDKSIDCSENCIYKRKMILGGVFKRNCFVRQTHQLCSICKNISVSEYDFKHCFECSIEKTMEYDYYHKKCRKF